MEFHHAHFNTDSYSHLSNFHPGSQNYQQIHVPDSRAIRYKEEPIHNMHGLSVPNDTRRLDYGGIRRSDVLVPGGHLGFTEHDPSFVHHNSVMQAIEDGVHQVSNILFKNPNTLIEL